MEDCCVIHQPGTWGCNDADVAYLGVYDGHGGRDIVEFLEDGLHENIAKELNHGDDADIPTRLERAFLITDVQSSMMKLDTSGATVAMCLIKKDVKDPNKVSIYAANVGDARAVLSCHPSNLDQNPSKSSCYRLTYDHRATDQGEMTRINTSGGFVLKERVMGVLAVSRSLGDHGLKDMVIARPHITSAQVDLLEDECLVSSKCGKFVVIACDGVFDVMEDQYVIDFVMAYCTEEGLSEQEIQERKENVAQQLVSEAISLGSKDNITAIVSWL